MSLQVFELSEVAGAADMPAARAKNWTIGRPLSIKPSIRDAGGTGSRNLYSLEDVYLMAFVHELWKAGFTVKAIQRVLDKLRTWSEIINSNCWGVVLHMRGHRTEIELIMHGATGIRVDTRKGIIVHHLVNISELRANVDARIKKPQKGGRK